MALLLAAAVLQCPTGLQCNPQLRLRGLSRVVAVVAVVEVGTCQTGPNNDVVLGFWLSVCQVNLNRCKSIPLHVWKLSQCLTLLKSSQK